LEAGKLCDFQVGGVCVKEDISVDIREVWKWSGDSDWHLLCAF